jgi:N-acetylglutamate synthase-like GNAT family acetyltransferase
MYVRDAKNRDEVWLLDRIEEMGLDDAAFRSRDYVVAVDEESDDRAGFGRFRIHKVADGEDVVELTGIGVLPGWRGQGVGAHVVERLVDRVVHEGFDRVYSLTDEPGYLAQFGFDPVAAESLPPRLQDRLDQKREAVDEDVVGMVLDAGEFAMPARLRERFKSASPRGDAERGEATETPEDFGIDPDEATYKYDTGR